MISIDKNIGRWDAGVYAIISKLDGGRIYVGQSINILKRIKQHDYKLSVGTHNNIELQKLYDMDTDFTVKVLEKVWYKHDAPKVVDIGALLRIKEAFYIIKYQNVCINRDSPYSLANKINSYYDNSISHYYTPKDRKIIDVYL